MASRLPSPKRKPAEQLARRNRPEEWTILPAEGCKIPVPKWPGLTAAQSALWSRLWRNPVAAWWHEQRIDPGVVARYVVLSLAQPAHATVSKLETELGLTPAAMLRMRLLVEHPAPTPAEPEDPYAALIERRRKEGKPI